MKTFVKQNGQLVILCTNISTIKQLIDMTVVKTMVYSQRISFEIVASLSTLVIIKRLTLL